MKKLMRVFPGNVSHIGGRQEQQDAFALSNFEDSDFVEHGGYLALLADGIGGMDYGAGAANLAVDAFLRRYLAKSVLREVEETLDAALQDANRAVLEEAERRDCLEHMGTTLVAAVLCDDRLYWRSVGDSRLYLLRAGRLAQLTTDHNHAHSLQALVAEGLISQNMADLHPDRGVLESFVGLNVMRGIDRPPQPLPLNDGDVLLLCSDGIYGGLSDQEMVACLAGEPMQAAQQLADAVLAKQLVHQDNLTAVVLHYRSRCRSVDERRLWRLRLWLYLLLVASVAVSTLLMLSNG